MQIYQKNKGRFVKKFTTGYSRAKILHTLGRHSFKAEIHKSAKIINLGALGLRPQTKLINAYLTSILELLLQFPTQATPLHLSARFNSSAEVVRALIEAGADVNALDSNQRSPLYSASSCNPPIVMELLEAKATVNLLDNFQWSPLLFAARREHKSVVAALLAAGADPHLGDETYLRVVRADSLPVGVSPSTSNLVSEDMKGFIMSFEPLSSLQPKFVHSYARTNFIFSDALLLHKLLVTGHGEQVLNRKNELDRDLVSQTCSMMGNWQKIYSKVRCRAQLIFIITEK